MRGDGAFRQGSCVLLPSRGPTLSPITEWTIVERGASSFLTTGAVIAFDRSGLTTLGVPGLQYRLEFIAQPHSSKELDMPPPAPPRVLVVSSPQPTPPSLYPSQVQQPGRKHLTKRHSANGSRPGGTPFWKAMHRKTYPRSVAADSKTGLQRAGNRGMSHCSGWQPPLAQGYSCCMSIVHKRCSDAACTATESQSAEAGAEQSAIGYESCDEGRLHANKPGEYGCT